MHHGWAAEAVSSTCTGPLEYTEVIRILSAAIPHVLQDGAMNAQCEQLRVPAGTHKYAAEHTCRDVKITVLCITSLAQSQMIEALAGVNW